MCKLQACTRTAGIFLNISCQHQRPLLGFVCGRGGGNPFPVFDSCILGESAHRKFSTTNDPNYCTHIRVIWRHIASIGVITSNRCFH